MITIAGGADVFDGVGALDVCVGVGDGLGDGLALVDGFGDGEVLGVGVITMDPLIPSLDVPPLTLATVTV